MARIRLFDRDAHRSVPIYFLDLTGRRKWSWFEEEHIELAEARAGDHAR